MEQNYYTEYVLNSGKTVGDWQLPISETLIEKFDENGESLGLRGIVYAKGAGTYWRDEIKGDYKLLSIWFKDGRLLVENSNKIKNALLKAHSFFNKKNGYRIYDKQEESRSKLEALRAKNEVVNLIATSDSDRIVATAMAVFGHQAYSWDKDTSELELRQYAEKDPVKLKNELSSKTYESKYLAALAFGKGVVKTNLGRTAIIWDNSTEGEIMKLARGENGISKLGELLSKKTDETELLLQAIGEQLDKIATETPVKKEYGKDDEIARLKAELAALKNTSTNLDTSNIEDLRTAYTNKFEKEVPPRYKNDSSWIQKKLSE